MSFHLEWQQLSVSLFHKGTGPADKVSQPITCFAHTELKAFLNTVVWTCSKCYLLCYTCFLQPTGWEAAALAEQPTAFTSLLKVPHCPQRQPA